MVRRRGASRGVRAGGRAGPAAVQRGEPRRDRLVGKLPNVTPGKPVKCPALVSEMVLLPMASLNLRSAKYNVCFKENALWAVRAQHEILNNMVVFTCHTCNETFPACHPAFQPPEDLGMQLLKRQKNGLAACDINVESWTELPVLYVKQERLEDCRANGPGSYESSAKRPVLAAVHYGRCLRCAKDIQEQ